MSNVSHLDEEATRHEKWTHFPFPFIFLSFVAPRFYGFFLIFAVNIVSINSLNYSVAQPGAGEVYWLTYIILHLATLCFRVNRFIVNKT